MISSVPSSPPTSCTVLGLKPTMWWYPMPAIRRWNRESGLPLSPRLKDSKIWRKIRCNHLAQTLFTKRFDSCCRLLRFDVGGSWVIRMRRNLSVAVALGLCLYAGTAAAQGRPEYITGNVGYLDLRQPDPSPKAELEWGLGLKYWRFVP